MLDICREYAHKKVVISAHGVVLAIMRITAQQAPIQQVFDFIPGNAVVHQIEITEGMI
jgi:broad specificity phosphatase PhoE